MAHRLSRFEKEKWVPDPTKQARRPQSKFLNRTTEAFVEFFLKHWHVVGSIIEKDLGAHLFQFKFEYEYDLQAILSKAPFHFKKWMIILQLWKHVVSYYFSALVPFWITIHRISLHY
ncbi:hypothetical protein N665_0802s0002 [Sinapis alba]|nr:hypothetical protein N665_0802s0002 [Sinapis alba]